MRPIRTTAAIVAAGAFFLTACGDDDDSTSTDEPTETTVAESSSADDETASGGETVDTVSILDFEYDPADATVAAGSEVTFTNADGTPHTATASGGEFNTESIESDAEGTITAPDEPGEYAYICSFHPFMKGTLIVE